MSLRAPVSPSVFLARVAWLEFLLCSIQLAHLVLVTHSQPRDFAAWLFVHATAQLTLYALRRSARQCRAFATIPWRPLAVLLVLTFVVKFYSRLPYVTTWLAEGLWAARNSEDISTGGGASFINIFFYPLAILLAFCVAPNKTYIKLLLCVIVMCMIDFIVLGTRNAPLFVLLFHMLAGVFKVDKKWILTVCAAILGFLAIFSYSTVNRTQESQLGTFDWLELFEHTGSAQTLRIDRRFAEPISAHVPALLPAIFLAHYVTHPIAELALLADEGDDSTFGGLYYLTDQICVVGVCSRENSLSAITQVNRRAGIYQTIWGSLLFDFGIGGAALVWTVVIAGIGAWQRFHRRVLSPTVVIASMVVSLAPIENYLYNGLGLVQILTMFIAYWMVQITGRKSSLHGRARASMPSLQPL